MNFFKLYGRATENYRIQSRLPQYTDSQLARVRDLYRDACYKPNPLDYSHPAVRVAYGHHYAPKHATAWCLFARNKSFQVGSKFNSIGTGPGSEVFGLIEAFRPTPGSVIEVCCLETNRAWDLHFDAAAAIYEEDTGVKVVPSRVTSPSRLHRNVPTVGSLVLAEVARHGDAREFLRSIAPHIAPSQGYFLDLLLFPVLRNTNGQLVEIMYGMPEALGFRRWPNVLKDMNLGIGAKCNEDMMKWPCKCRKPVTGETGMLFYPWTFS